MLTRLKVSGFKNLVDVDVRFGAFTCIAGANGVGKSNLFDAILFLSALASRPLTDAVRSGRDEGGRTTDLRNIFNRTGSQFAEEISFEAEMIVPREGQDDLGQTGKASITFLRYSLTLAYREDHVSSSSGSLEIIKEELRHITRGETKKNLLFPHKVEWRQSVVKGERRTTYLISTQGEGDERVIKLHQDGGSGRPLALLAVKLPRTVLSSVNAAESPTALLARREMQSWQLLQLEPSALRQPDEFTAPTRMGAAGAHLPATLNRLAKASRSAGTNPDAAEASIYARVANRLSELIDDVREVSIDRDEKRELLSLLVRGRDGTPYAARALSDGTLRFLALSVLELDPESQGVLCLEEPENGIHPERIPAIIRLLEAIAMDVYEPADADNPLRQVIINTHSPAVVAQVPSDSLIVAELKVFDCNGGRFKRTSFSCLEGTWRARAGMNTVAKGKLLSYLNPVLHADVEEEEIQKNDKPNGRKKGTFKKRRVIDHPGLQLLIPMTIHET